MAVRKTTENDCKQWDGILELRKRDLAVLQFLSETDSPCIDTGNLFSVDDDLEMKDITSLERLGVIESCDLNVHYKITDYGREVLETGKIPITVFPDSDNPDKATMRVRKNDICDSE